MRWLISEQTWGGGLLVDGGMMQSFLDSGKGVWSGWVLSSDEKFCRLKGEIGMSWDGGEIVENRRFRGDLEVIWGILGTEVVESGTTDVGLPLRGESSTFIGWVESIFRRDATTGCLVGDNTIECRLRLRGIPSFFGVLESIFGKEAASESFVGENVNDSRPRELSRSSRRLSEEEEDLKRGCDVNLFFKDKSIVSKSETRVSSSKRTLRRDWLAEDANDDLLLGERVEVDISGGR